VCKPLSFLFCSRFSSIFHLFYLFFSLDKDPTFGAVVKTLCGEVQQYIDHNNTIDMFETYFEDEEPETQLHSLSASTSAVYRDQSGESEHRAVTKICWHPEGSHRLRRFDRFFRFLLLEFQIFYNISFQVSQLFPPKVNFC
jgi:hypothetical protein